MNFFKKLKELFGEGTGIDEKIQNSNYQECFWCEEYILPEHTKKTFNKRKFHIKCYRQMIKEVKKDMGA